MLKTIELIFLFLFSKSGFFLFFEKKKKKKKKKTLYLLYLPAIVVFLLVRVNDCWCSDC
jgi:hypothetical protein